MTDTDVDRLLRSADPAAHLTAPAPPPFREEAEVVQLRPRRSRWLPAASAAAAVAAVVGLAVVTTGSGGVTRAAGPDPTGTPTAVAGPPPADPNYQQVQIALVRNLPPDFTLVIGDLKPPRTSSGTTDREYVATWLVRYGSRTGTVKVTYETGLPPADLCRISEKLRMAGSCRLVRTAAGKTVALTDADPAYGYPGVTTQWALYQHPDGAIVLVAQGVGTEKGGEPWLGHQIWSAARLAEVATDPAFRR